MTQQQTERKSHRRLHPERRPMTNKTMTAFTPTEYKGSYPPYFNVSLHNNEVVVTVRGPVTDDGLCGETVSMTMSPTQFGLCMAEIESELK